MPTAKTSGKREQYNNSTIQGRRRGEDRAGTGLPLDDWIVEEEDSDVAPRMRMTRMQKNVLVPIRSCRMMNNTASMQLYVERPLLE